MTIMSVTRWSCDKSSEVVEAARKAKRMHEKHGTKGFHLSRIHAGDAIGEWVIVTSFASWEDYGQVQAALARDSEYQALFAQVEGFAKLTGRTITVGIDL